MMENMASHIFKFYKFAKTIVQIKKNCQFLCRVLMNFPNIVAIFKWNWNYGSTYLKIKVI